MRLFVKGSVPRIYHGAEGPIYKRLFSKWNGNAAGRGLEMNSRTIEDRERRTNRKPTSKGQPNRWNRTVWV